MAVPHIDKISRALAHSREYFAGRLIFWRYRRKFRAIFAEVNPLAAYLEFDLFPDLREEKVEAISIATDPERGELHFVGEGRRYAPYQAPRLVQELEQRNIRRIELDTALESGQIGEAVLVLLRARRALASVEPADTPYTGWAPEKVAAALVGRHGYQKFCAIVRVNRRERSVQVGYAYCPLLFSRLVERYADSAGRFADHRAFFHLAPRAALFGLLLFTIPALCLMLDPVLSVVATAAVGLPAAALVWLGLHTIGCIQYDKEHYERVRKAHLDQNRHLARFPEANPDPIIEIDLAGEILYVNPAANRLLSRMGVPPVERGVLLPADRADLASRAMQSEARTHTLEHTVGDRRLRYTASAFPDDKTVIVSGKDVTRLRATERELRSLNVELEERIRERTMELALTQDVTIMCLAGLAETRDPETGLHLDRTRHYVRALAECLRDHPRFQAHLSDDAIHRAFKSAPLHDIGKVGISDAILLKPGKLTPEEFEEVKNHTLLGGDALRIAEERLGFNSFLTMGKEIAYHHHERWDGKGYPFGLSGDAIPWPARLMSVADVYDALTSKRPYKEPWTHEAARAEILKHRGTQFDPDAVDAFVTIEGEFERFAREYAEP